MVLPASVLREGISNITLTVGELGAWISKNRMLNRVVARRVSGHNHPTQPGLLSN